MSRTKRVSMSMAIQYDVFGTGPGGDTITYRLDLSGKKILLLERGDCW